MQSVRTVLRASVARLQTRNAASAPSANDRQMKYPYTLGAKINHFPYKLYWDNSWLVRYLIAGYGLTFLVYWKINKMVNSPGNVAAYEERKRKEKEAAHHH